MLDNVRFSTSLLLAVIALVAADVRLSMAEQLLESRLRYSWHDHVKIVACESDDGWEFDQLASGNGSCVVIFAGTIRGDGVHTYDQFAIQLPSDIKAGDVISLWPPSEFRDHLEVNEIGHFCSNLTEGEAIAVSFHDGQTAGAVSELNGASSICVKSVSNSVVTINLQLLAAMKCGLNIEIDRDFTLPRRNGPASDRSPW